ncbi:hypothetical protein ACFCYC_35990 [Streptomyces sp. NPDC056402]|uniref:hypothetical protein n=1 Tax=Streptomyces sp. NPDC056402 TaxID=3345810 RepID=UPI0035D8BC43
MADEPDEGSRRSIEEMYDYTTSILAGSEDYTLMNEGVFPGWYDADGKPCTMRKFKFGPGGDPVPRDPNEPPPVHRP